MERAIIHINVADFAVAVERRVDSRLAGRPVIIAPEGAPRAVVYDMSEEAFRTGVRKGMPLRRALRLCRDARVLPPHPSRYEQAMGALFRRALTYSPRVEPGDRDGHLFLDITGTGRLFGPPADVAWRLQRQARTDLGLHPIWSVAPNKLVAKVASRLVKPVGEYIVGAGEEAALLAPLPLALIPGIEGSDLRRLAEFNLSRVFQAAALDAAHLEMLFGTRSRFLFETVRGIDRSPVLPAGERPLRIVRGHEFGTDTNDIAVLEQALFKLVEEIGVDLRRQGRAARRIAVFLDYADGMRRRRQGSLRPASANDPTLFETARAVLALAADRRMRVRHLRLLCDRLVFPPTQLELFASAREDAEKQTRLIATIDGIRGRFGRSAVKMGRMMAA